MLVRMVGWLLSYRLRTRCPWSLHERALRGADARTVIELVRFSHAWRVLLHPFRSRIRDVMAAVVTGRRVNAKCWRRLHPA